MACGTVPHAKSVIASKAPLLIYIEREREREREQTRRQAVSPQLSHLLSDVSSWRHPITPLRLCQGGIPLAAVGAAVIGDARCTM